jgi:hypothetical protein
MANRPFARGWLGQRVDLTLTNAPLGEASVASRGHLELEIFSQGGREGREARIWGKRYRQRVCNAIAGATSSFLSRDIFLVLVLQKQKCALASRTSRPPALL